MPLQFVAQGPMLLPSVGGNPLTDGLVSYWIMGEGSGATMGDSVGSNPGTLQAGSAFSGSFLNILPTSDVRVAKSASLLSNGSTFAIFGWVNSIVASADVWFAGQWDFGSINQRSWAIGGAATTGVLKVVCSTDGLAGQKNYVGSQAFANSTGTFPGTPSVGFRFNAGVVDLFVGGVKDASVDKTASDISCPTLFNSSADLIFGALLSNNALAADTLNGFLKKWKLFNTLKSDADFAALHAAGP